MTRHVWFLELGQERDALQVVRRASRNGWDVQVISVPGASGCVVVATDRRWFLARWLRPLPEPQVAQRTPAGTLALRV